MQGFETVQIVVPYREPCQDRVAVIQAEDCTLLIVADGAGGSGDGAAAADRVLREIQAEHHSSYSSEQWEAKLVEIDFRVGTGESTAVIVCLGDDGIRGASVGDSQAWLVHDGNITCLTAKQQRKPLLGSGSARPVGFQHGRWQGTLLVGTDGFFNYVKREALTALVAQTDFLELPRRCVEMVRLPSGALWDDIGILACRPKPILRPRQRYTI